MPPAEKKWDANAERDLCVAVIMGAQEGERMRYNWPKVHSAMDALGYSFTKDAISQHFSKSIMRDFKNRHGDSSNGDSPAPTPGKATGTRKRAAATKGRKKKKPASDEDEDEGAEDAAPESPLAKKVKRTKKDKDDDVKDEGAGERKRERSATAADADAKFEAWYEAGKADEE